MKAILKSLVVIGTVAGLTIGATSAFFSDVETSTGNVFTAGGIDLKIDNTCHWSGEGPCPWDNVGDQKATWSESDLTPGVHKFFNFSGIKPGDYGEDTISLHVINNDAWGRLIINNVTDSDVDCTEPEKGSDDPECSASPIPSPAPGDGELRENLNFWVWLDQGGIPGFQGRGQDPEEGDNIWQPDVEPPLITPGTIEEEGETWNLWEGLAAAWVFNGGVDRPGILRDGRLVGSVTYYFGIGWELPSGVGNDVQTDQFGGDMTFEVVQYRNNPSPFPTPTP